jgi:amino acid adenylation domain-containing protein
MNPTAHSLTGDYVHPASSGQRRLWFLRQLDSTRGAADHLHGAYLAGAALNRLHLQRALNHVVARHEALRTRFAEVDGQLVQVVSPGAQVTIATADLTTSTPDEAWARMTALSERQARAPFNLEHGPLLRFVLVALPDERQVVLFTLHHMIADGWSMWVFLRELGECYRATCLGIEPRLPPPDMHFADYTGWQREWESTEDYAAQRAHWVSTLDTAPKVLEIPTDRARPSLQSFRGATVDVELPAAVTEALHDCARTRGLTHFVVLLTGFQVLLNRYTGSTDFLIGTQAANRERPEFHQTIGFFSNSLVLRADLSGDPSVAELFARTREHNLAALYRQRFPFERLVRELHPDRDPSRNPLFQILFALEDERYIAPTLDGLPLQRLDVSGDSANFDLSMFVVESPARTRLRIEYCTDLYDRSTIERLAERYITVLRDITRHPERTVSAVRLLSDHERRHVLAHSSGGSTRPILAPVPRLFEQQVEQSPQATALVHEDHELTYRQLNERANQIAHHLLDDGVGTGHRVAIYLPRTPDLIASLLAVLKIGATYVPLDPTYPEHRNGLIRRAAAPTTTLTTERLAAVTDRPIDNPAIEISPESPAYLIYTSGSTGTPKGISVPHRAVSNLVAWAHDSFSPAQTAGTVAVSSVSFDASVFEIFTPLTRGSTVILADNGLDIPDDPRITLVNIVPSVVAELYQSDRIPRSVTTITLCGEASAADLTRKLCGTVEHVYNVYGPTETTVYSSYTRLGPHEGDPVPIGAPIHNTRAYILDDHLELVPFGLPGELFIAGAGVTHGYHGDPATTAAAFVPDPFGDTGDRLYRTGDLVRWRSDGQLEYLGRNDHQIKLRGHRIELGDIEAAVLEHPLVTQAVAVAEEGEDTHRILAYVATSGDVEADELVRQLRDELTGRLPRFMIPSGFVVLDRLPLTPNGKIDRCGLHASDESIVTAHRDYLAPRNDTETAIARLWSELLGIHDVGANDNFFDLGGDSLATSRMVQVLCDRYDVSIPVREILLDATVARLAALVDGSREEQRHGTRTVPPTPQLDELSDAEFDALIDDLAVTTAWENNQ